MEQVGQGDYAIRVDGPLSPELARLRDTFNRMAGRLAETSADNRRLHEQLMTLQEEERNDLARDLHDEVGPFLFAINVDVANMTRLVKEGQTSELPDHLQSIGDAARHLQRQVRGMLGRLRPIGLAELGLAGAVGSLIEFWRRRYPAIEYRTTIAPACENQGDAVDKTVYRIVQEGLSNAVRHGQPKRIAISVDRDPENGDTIIDVSDDGSGSGDVPALGYGLIGMEERVKAMGGRLKFLSRAGGGFAINAALPRCEPLAEAAS
jgi:two-component system sensor histidine kinase UhpB